MSRSSAPGVAQERARRVARHLLGGSELRSMLLVVFLLAGVGWFTDSLYGWLQDIGDAIEGRPPADWFPIYRLLAVGIFAVEFLMVYRLARHASDRLRPTATSDRQPNKVKGLVLYLSPLDADKADRVRETLATSCTSAEILAAIRDGNGLGKKLSWRMPIEAIAFHQPRLTQVQLICSNGERGSARQAALFDELVARLFGDIPLEIVDGGSSEGGAGIDFEDVVQLCDVTDQAYERLRAQGIAARDILVDITGGQKTTAIAGAAVALAEGRHIQYVTQNYQVLVYDVTYHD